MAACCLRFASSSPHFSPIQQAELLLMSASHQKHVRIRWTRRLRRRRAWIRTGAGWIWTRARWVWKSFSQVFPRPNVACSISILETENLTGHCLLTLSRWWARLWRTARRRIQRHASPWTTGRFWAANRLWWGPLWRDGSCWTVSTHEPILLFSDN